MRWRRLIDGDPRVSPARRLGTWGAGLLCALTSLGAALAEANELQSEPVPNVRLHAPLDQTLALQARGDVAKVVVSQPEIIEVGSAGEDALYVIGRQPGAANILVYDRLGQLTQTVDVQVGHDAAGLQDALAQALPDERIRVTPIAGGVLLDGEVSSPGAAAIAQQLAQRAAPDAVLSRLVVRGDQVSLRVRIVEVNRRRLRDLGAEFVLSDGDHTALALGSGPLGAEPPAGVATLRLTPGDYQLDARLQALAARGRIEILAEPTLVARSGEPASFRAGGELPYAVPNGNGGLGLEFKPYGASVVFTPAVQSNGLVRLKLDAELSSLDPAVGLRVADVTVPALLVRRASTTIELNDGDSYVIAGLFEDYERRATRGPPWLNRLPLVGQLLSALQVADDERELAIIVTPSIVATAEAPPARAAAPFDQAAAQPDAKAASAGKPPARASPVRTLVVAIRRAVSPPATAIRRLAMRVVTMASRRA